VEQLGFLDHSMLLMESPRHPNHVTPVQIYDPSTAPGGAVSFEDVFDAVRRRLPTSRTLRRKLVRVPLDLDQAYWIEDANFDLEFHVRQIALPRPGDWRQFCQQVARLSSRPLDLSRPPWEMTVIEGVDNIEGLPKGCFAIVLKVHHAAIDGVEGVELITSLHDQSPDADPVELEDRWRSEPDPSPLALLARAGAHTALSPLHAVRLVAANAAPLVRELPRRLRRSAGRIGSMPRTRFNHPVSGHKVFDETRFKTSQIKRLRSAVPGATVNDVALAVVGGAMRRYLLHVGELPEEPLVAMVPISTRAADRTGTGGNQVAMMRTSLATTVGDPLERLAAIHAATSASKAAQSGVAARALREVSQTLPGALLGIGVRTAGLLPNLPVMTNTLVTNVPGPRQALYLCGARLVRMTGCVPLYDGMGLGHCISSYGDEICFIITADRDMLPDPEFYVDCLRAAFTELDQAVPEARQATRRSSAGPTRARSAPSPATSIPSTQ
jgi:WS/DGAT/MGAT family acyltransferase